MIKNITLDELRGMRNTEGLILQGCGGDPQEWLDGINEILTEAGILINGGRFTDISVFEHDGRTNILFHFGDEINPDTLQMGKLAMWRLRSRSTFGGTWLSDYMQNTFGIDMSSPAPAQRKKPECPMIGADSNIFNILGIASRTLKRNGMADEAQEMRSRVTESGSYENALAVIMEYVEPISAGGQDRGGMEMGM